MLSPFGRTSVPFPLSSLSLSCCASQSRLPGEGGRRREERGGARLEKKRERGKDVEEGEMVPSPFFPLSDPNIGPRLVFPPQIEDRGRRRPPSFFGCNKSRKRGAREKGTKRKREKEWGRVHCVLSAPCIAWSRLASRRERKTWRTR